MDSMSSTGIGGSANMQLPVANKKETTGSASPAQSSEQVKAQAVGPADSPKSQEQIIADLQKAIDAIQGPQKSLEISVHKETHAIMIKVLNKETGELIREVPPEKILDLAARMMEITGIIVDKKV
ncbi:flagellar protein FlaG [compost metagenome]